MEDKETTFWERPSNIDEELWLKARKIKPNSTSLKFYGGNREYVFIRDGKKCRQ